jgi:trehalose 6-phosphate synthase
VTLRLIAAIWVGALVIIAAFAYLQVREERQRILADLERRAALLGEGLRESLEPAMARNATRSVARLLKKFARPDRHILVYDAVAGQVAAAPEPDPPMTAALPEATEAISRGEVVERLRAIRGRPVYVYATPLQSDERTTGGLAVLLDASDLEAAESGLWRYNAIRFLFLALGLSVITGLVVRMTITRPMSAIAEWAKTLRAGRPAPLPALSDANLFGPLATEVTGLAKSLYRARAAAETEAALRLSGEAIWTEERLKQFALARVGDGRLFVVSNREPLSHVWEAGKVVAHTPASGVVTATDPVMRACGGVWVAHGSGSADREASDAQGRLELPPGDPRYTLRRVWLSKEEEEGYYYGFSNEGLWPLCHVVHARPAFRAEDWTQYRAVNEKFAAALLEEMDDVSAPIVLVHDYHFALLPAMIKAARPDARVGIFWHIPWPNFEAFGICPWGEEILQGMLGADLIGFHTQYHCNNFLDSVERALQARIDAEHFTVIRGERTTQVKPFPISVAPEFAEDPVSTSREELLEQLGISAEFLGVGVERVDYTKGLPERFLSLQRFFERHPEYRERLVFVQVAAPSRSRIKRYRELQAEVEETVAAVNRAVGTRHWRPIVYLERHFDRRDLWPLYRHADFCMVTSLHDGMNLVAKEFVSVREDGDGVLILSRYTGAARELADALLVNPYDVGATAEAIRTAIEMPAHERLRRMTAMHQLVREHNIYRWAGLLLGDLSRIRAETAAARHHDGNGRAHALTPEERLVP